MAHAPVGRWSPPSPPNRCAQSATEPYSAAPAPSPRDYTPSTCNTQFSLRQVRLSCLLYRFGLEDRSGIVINIAKIEKMSVETLNHTM